MYQVLFRIPIRTQATPDGIPVYGFGMMLFLAFIACTWLAGRRAEREGIRKETIQDLAIWLFLGGLIGARVTYLLTERPWLGFKDFVYNLPAIWEGGIVFYGSLIGGTISYFLAYFLVFKKHGVKTRRLLDAIAPSIALGLCLGRMGCFLNGCCFGSVACASCAAVTPVAFPLAAPCRDVLVAAGLQTVAGFSLAQDARASGVVVGEVDPSSDAFRAGLQPGSVIVAANGQQVNSRGDLQKVLAELPRGQSWLELEFEPQPGQEAVTETIYPRTLGLYPTQIYEVVSMALLMLVLMAYYPFRHNPGQVLAVLMVGYGVHRYLNEILRGDPRPVSLESYGSILLIVGGVLMWLWLWRKQPDEPVQPIVPATTTAPSPGIRLASQ